MYMYMLHVLRCVLLNAIVVEWCKCTYSVYCYSLKPNDHCCYALCVHVSEYENGSIGMKL